MPPRPADAPQGMIRAHLATFPPRAGIFRKVVEAILPQVDRLFIVFNGYDRVPDDIADEPWIEAVVPDRDVKDAGKFWFPPGPDDIVFLIDDDIGYPSDYVAASIAEAGRIGWDRTAFGHLGLSWNPQKPDGSAGWKMHKFHGLNRHARGVDVVGTGTAVTRGDMIPALAVIAPYAGYVDIGFAIHLRDQGGAAWLLPHEEGWLTNDLPPELYEGSLFATHAGRKPLHVQLSTHRLVAEAPANRDIPFHKYRKIDQPALQE